MKTDIDAKEIGFALAHSDDDSQSEVINEFAKEMTIACRTASRRESQICYTSDKLNQSGKDFIKDMYEFIMLREKEDKKNEDRTDS